MPQSETQLKVVMYCTSMCPFCRMADNLLVYKGVSDVQQIRVDLEPALRQKMMQRTGRWTVPQIFIGGTHVGGYDELSRLDRAGELDALLTGDAMLAGEDESATD